MKVYQKIAGLMIAMENCTKNGNTEWYHNHEESLDDLMARTAPSGSGFGGGTRIDSDQDYGKADKGFKLATAFHHMNDGYYDGWTEHIVAVKPSLAFDFVLTISGPDKNDIKDYIHEVFSAWLDSEVVA